MKTYPLKQLVIQDLASLGLYKCLNIYIICPHTFGFCFSGCVTNSQNQKGHSSWPFSCPIPPIFPVRMGTQVCQLTYRPISISVVPGRTRVYPLSERADQRMYLQWEINVIWGACSFASRHIEREMHLILIWRACSFAGLLPPACCPRFCGDEGLDMSALTISPRVAVWGRNGRTIRWFLLKVDHRCGAATARRVLQRRGANPRAPRDKPWRRGGR